MDNPATNKNNDDNKQNYTIGVNLGRMILIDKARQKGKTKINISSLSIIQNAPGPRITYPLPEDFDPFPEFPEYKLKYTRKELCDMFWEDYGGKPSAAENNENKQHNASEAANSYNFCWKITGWSVIDGNT